MLVTTDNVYLWGVRVVISPHGWGVRGFPPKKILKNRSNLAPSDVSPESTVEIACLCSEYLPTKMTDCSDMDPNRRQIFLTAARPCPTRPPYPYPVSLKTPRQMADLIISNRFQFNDFFMKKVWGSYAYVFNHYLFTWFCWLVHTTTTKIRDRLKTGMD